jgi:NitT/TauT family transport system substrate-binding protein
MGADLRRPAAVALLAAAVAAAACSRAKDDRPFRLGYFPNVTHAQAIVGVDDGSIASALGGRIEARMFNAGPAAMEALLAGELDASYVGPSPALIAHLRSKGEGLRVVAGATSGGAVLVVRDARKAGDLAGKRVASPQLGNTQDVMLRVWLRQQGLSDKAGPRGVEVTPLANPDILTMFARGDLAGAWVPEPWGARLVAEAGGRILLDERTLWDRGRFPTTILVVSKRALDRRPNDVAALLRAHVALTRRWQQDPRAFGKLVNEGYGKRTGKPLPDGILADALSRIEPTDDPMAPQLAEMARHAQALGYAPPGDVSGIVDAKLLSEIAKR